MEKLLLLLLDEDKDTKGIKGAIDRPLKKRRQEVSNIVEVSSKGAQSVKASIVPSVGVKAREGSRDATSTCLSAIAEFAQLSFTTDSGKECLKALIVLSRVLLAKVNVLEIPYRQTKEALL